MRRIAGTRSVGATRSGALSSTMLANRRPDRVWRLDRTPHWQWRDAWQIDPYVCEWGDITDIIFFPERSADEKFFACTARLLVAYRSGVRTSSGWTDRVRPASGGSCAICGKSVRFTQVSIFGKSCEGQPGIAATRSRTEWIGVTFSSRDAEPPIGKGWTVLFAGSLRGLIAR